MGFELLVCIFVFKFKSSFVPLHLYFLDVYTVLDVTLFADSLDFSVNQGLVALSNASQPLRLLGFL